MDSRRATYDMIKENLLPRPVQKEWMAYKMRVAFYIKRIALGPGASIRLGPGHPLYDNTFLLLQYDNREQLTQVLV
jgi:hypothetical protein